MYDWIYSHFINTYWFLLLSFSFPAFVLFYLLYSSTKNQDNEINESKQKKPLSEE